MDHNQGVTGMTVDGVQVDKGRLWQALGQLQEGQSGLKDGQKAIKGEIA